MQTIIFWLLVAIALLICAIAWLVIYISGLQAKLKASYTSNKEIYKGYLQVKKEKEELIDDNIKLKSKLSGYELSGITKKIVKRATTADYKKAIIKDYKAGADVHDIATKYSLKANTVFKAIARRKAKGEI